MKLHKKVKRLLQSYTKGGKTLSFPKLKSLVTVPGLDVATHTGLQQAILAHLSHWKSLEPLQLIGQLVELESPPLLAKHASELLKCGIEPDDTLLMYVQRSKYNHEIIINVLPHFEDQAYIVRLIEGGQLTEETEVATLSHLSQHNVRKVAVESDLSPLVLSACIPILCGEVPDKEKLIGLFNDLVKSDKTMKIFAPLLKDLGLSEKELWDLMTINSDENNVKKFVAEELYQLRCVAPE